MPSYDKRWTIERYPWKNEDGSSGYSYGCPELDLMGYQSYKELLIDIAFSLLDIHIMKK